MFTKAARLAVVAALLAALLLPEQASAATRLRADLSGKEEVPAGTGDPDGDGVAHLTLKIKRKKLCFEISFTNIGNAVSAHVHTGEAGQEGGIFIELFSRPEGIASPVDDCVRVRRSNLVELRDRHTHYYVNVHTSPFPDGAIRGQLALSGPA